MCCDPSAILPSPGLVSILHSLFTVQAQELVSSVLPFDTLTFRSLGGVRGRRGAGLEALENAARRLLFELQVEAQATGLDVQVQVRTLLYSMNHSCYLYERYGRGCV